MKNGLPYHNGQILTWKKLQIKAPNFSNKQKIRIINTETLKNV